MTEGAVTARPIAGAPDPTEGDGRRSPGRAERQWYVVYTKPHQEASAHFQLELKGIEVFFPKLLLPPYVPARRRLAPLFPGYLFTRIDLLAQFHDVVWTPGVKRLVGCNGLPTPLGDDVVAFLRRRATPEGVLAARAKLSVGEEVEITAGPFAGIVGIIERAPDPKGRIAVLMQLLSRRAVRVNVPLHFVKSDWVP